MQEQKFQRNLEDLIKLELIFLNRIMILVKQPLRDF